MKKVLFMSEQEARSTLYCAGLKGKYEIFVVGNTEKNKTIRFHPMCNKFIELKSPLIFNENSENVAKELVLIIKQHLIDILFPVSITCSMIIDRHKDIFKDLVTITPFPTKESVDLLDNKFNFYQFCLDNNIAHPNSKLAESVGHIDLNDIGVNFPLLIKPLLGAGGFDTLVFVKNRDEMNSFIAKPEIDTKDYFPALLQEYFEGDDIDFNGFSVNGKVVASSVMRTKFDENNSKLYFTDFTRNDEVIKLGKKILYASRYSGATNIDMRIRQTDGKLMLIEVNPRYWARVPVSLMDGMNFLDIALVVAEGLAINVNSKSSTRVWTSSLSSLLKAIIKEKKINYIKYLFLLSKEQIKLIIFTRRYHKLLRKRGIEPN